MERTFNDEIVWVVQLCNGQWKPGDGAGQGSSVGCTWYLAFFKYMQGGGFWRRRACCCHVALVLNGFACNISGGQLGQAGGVKHGPLPAVETLSSSWPHDPHNINNTSNQVHLGALQSFAASSPTGHEP